MTDTNLILVCFSIGFIFFIIIIKKQNKMSEQLTNLTQQVTEITAIAENAITLIGSLKTGLDAAIQSNRDGDDGAALDALSATLSAEKDKLAATIAANTPAAEATADTTEEVAG